MSKDRFVKLPLEPAAPWFALRYTDRSLGADLFRVFGNDELIDVPMAQIGDVVCRRLAVDGRDRPTVRRALERLQAAGLLVSEGASTRLLYSQQSYRAHQSSPRPPSGDRPVNDQPMVSERSVNGQSSVSEPSVNGQATVSQGDLSTRCPSNDVRQIDREIERKKEVERASAERPPLATAFGREPLRFRQPLEDSVRAEFFARRVTPQKASPSQWRDGCQTVQDALDLGAFPGGALEAIAAFSKLLVETCAKGEKLGFALQQVPLTGKLEAEPKRQLSELALKTLAASGGRS